MDDPAPTGPGLKPATGPGEVDEFADVPSPRTRHPALALGAGLLAIFLVVKMRSDLSYFLSSREPADLGDARALATTDRGRAVLAEGVNRLVRVHGTPDRESALQVDTKGSWTFTQFFRILGTDSRLFVHRLEDPLPAFRAEADVFEGRLIRFSDLSFEDAIRAYFASHVSATHFFKPDDLRRVIAAGVAPTVTLRDLGGDSVTLGPNDILAFDLRHADEVEVSLSETRYHDAETARAALVKKGARVTGPGRPTPGRQVWLVAVPRAARDRVLDAIGELDTIDTRADIRDVHEMVKARLGDLAVDGDRLTLAAPSGAEAAAGATAPPTTTRRPLDGIETIRTLAPVQIPPDAYLIIEAEIPRAHLSEVGVALVLLVFASVNLVGLKRRKR